LAYKTGRSRTIGYSGDIITGAFIDVVCGPVPPNFPSNVIHANGGYSVDLSISCEGLEITISTLSSFKNNLDPCSVSDDGERECQLTLGVTFGGESLYSQTETLVEEGSLGTLTLDGNGAWSFSAVVEEWCDPGTYSGSTDSFGYPVIAGQVQNDGIPATGVRFYEKFQEDSSVSIAVSAGTLSYSGTAAASATEITHEVAGSAYVVGSNTTGTCAATFLFNGQGLGCPYNVSVPGAKANAESGVSATITSLGWNVGVSSQCSATLGPPIDYSLLARVSSFGKLCLGTFQTDIQVEAGTIASMDTSPTGGLSWQQLWYSASAVLNGVVQDSLVHLGRAPVSSWLNQAALRTGGDDVRDIRVQTSGFKRDAVTLLHSASVTLDNGSTATPWSPGAHSSVTATTDSGRSVILISASGGTGSAIRTWAPISDVEVYRYLRFSARASTTCTVEILLAGQTWYLDLTSTYQDIDLDLCCAGDDSGPVGPMNTRYPIESNGGFPTNTPPTTQYSFGWGVNYIDTLTINNLPNGVSVFIDSISTVRGTDAKLSFIAPFLFFPTGWINNGGGGGDVTSLQPYAYVQVDGRGPLDFPHGAFVDTTSIDYYRMYAISELVDMWNDIPGLAAANMSDAADGYHENDTLLAMTLAGGGATFDYDSEAWTNWIDRDVATSTLTMESQDIWDQVSAYPGAGDIWTSDLYDVPIRLATNKYLRGAINGLTYDSPSVPSENVSIVAWEATGPLAGIGMSGVDGRYITDQPFGFGNLPALTIASGLSDIVISSLSTWENRLRQRASFLVTGVPCGGTPPRLPSDCSGSTAALPFSSGETCGVGGSISLECDCNQTMVRYLPTPGGSS